MRKVIILIAFIILIFSSFIGCSKQEEASAKSSSEETVDKTEQPTKEPTPEPTPTVEPTPTPVPLLIPDNIFYDRNVLIKTYDNGEYGWIGDISVSESIKKIEEEYYATLIKADMKEAGIPIIADNSNILTLKFQGYEAIARSELDQAAYDKQYGEQIKEIESKYSYSDEYQINAVRAMKKTGHSFAYLIDTSDKKGVVPVSFYTYNKQDYKYINLDVFRGTTITDIGLGMIHIVGLTEDGSVVSYIMEDQTVRAVSDHGQSETSDWTNIVDVSAGVFHTLGLKDDGTVVAVGNNDNNQCDVSEWRDIVAVEAGGFSSYGIKSDGSVVSTGPYWNVVNYVEDWSNIVKVLSDGTTTVGLDGDGSLFVTGTSTGIVSWDVVDEPVFTDVQDFYIYNNVVFALYKSGEFDIVTIYDYLTEDDEFSSGIEDIANTGRFTYAVLKGQDVVHSYPDSDNTDWDSISSQSAMHIQSTYPTYATISINDDGELLINEPRIQFREYKYSYESKIIAFDAFYVQPMVYVFAIAENGDVIMLSRNIDDEEYDYEEYIVNESSTSGYQMTRVHKAAANNIVFFLDSNGNLHAPDIIKAATQEVINVYIADKTNWFKDTDLAQNE